MLQAIIFDFDGTIANSTVVHWKAFNRLFQNYGITVSWQEWTNELLGKKSEKILSSVLKKHSIEIHNDDIDKLQSLRRSYYRELIKQGELQEIEGFSVFFNWLTSKIKESKREIPLIIATNSHPESITPSLNVLGLLGKITYYSTETKNGRISKKQLLERILSDELKIDKKNWSDCLVFEDSVHGAKAAKSIDLKVIIINTSKLPLEKFSADLIVPNYNSQALKRLINKLW